MAPFAHDERQGFGNVARTLYLQLRVHSNIMSAYRASGPNLDLRSCLESRNPVIT